MVVEQEMVEKWEVTESLILTDVLITDSTSSTMGELGSPWSVTWIL